MTQSPYSIGIHTLHDECTREALPVQGNIPPWLNGFLIRNGPAKFDVPARHLKHWFDGFAMLHRFAFNPPEILYTNKYLHTGAYKEAEQTGDVCRGEYAISPQRSFLTRACELFDPRLTDNTSVHVTKIGEKFLAMTETRLLTEFNPETLETIGTYAYNTAPGETPLGQVSIAHPHFDAKRNCLYNYVLNISPRCTFSIFSTDAMTGKQKVLSKQHVSHPPYIHSFGMSENYIIMAEPPFFAHPLKMMYGAWPLVENYSWEPEKGTRFLIISRENGDVVKTVYADPIFLFHHVNAYEENDSLIVDISAYPDTQVIDQLYLDYLHSPARMSQLPKVHRYTIDMNGKDTIDCRLLSDTYLEMPRINYCKTAGKRYRYVYGNGSNAEENAVDFACSIVKVDADTGVFTSWEESGCYAGEPVFVPRPDAEKEDDGVVLSVVLDTNNSCSFLLVLDAATLNEIARAHVPHHIPCGFHGVYFGTVCGTDSFRNLHR